MRSYSLYFTTAFGSIAPIMIRPDITASPLIILLLSISFVVYAPADIPSAMQNAEIDCNIAKILLT